MKFRFRFLVSIFLVLSMVVSLNATYSNAKNKSFDWNRVEASPEDLSTLASYSQNLSITENSLITDKRTLNRIIKSISKNKELTTFSSKKDIENLHKGTFFLGKSQYSYNVYGSIFEKYDPKTQKGWSMLVFYDIDREILLESFLINQDGETIELKNRNNVKGISLKANKKELERQGCKNCGFKTVSSDSYFSSGITKSFIDQTASAKPQIGICQIGCLPDSSCKWVSLVTCTLYAFLPGGIFTSPICGAVTTLVCP